MRMENESILTILRHLPGHIRAPMERTVPLFLQGVQEIVLRADRPIAIECADHRFYLSESGNAVDSLHTVGLLKASASDIFEIFKSICDYSVYARQDELNRGYITIENGVRVGICGTAVVRDGIIVNIKDITTLSFRVAREVIGCSCELIGMIRPLDGVLIVGPPSSGKTTLIRDMTRILSERHKVSVIDERNEISATVGGRSGCDIGMADVIVGMDKGRGIITALRSMSPDLIICDELSGKNDADALRYALRCGVSFIATVHARDIGDLRSRPVTAELLNTGAFRYVVFLDDRHNAGRIGRIYEMRDRYR